MSLNFTVNTLILAKKYDSENLNKSDEKTFDPNQFQILGQQKSEWTEEKTEREMRKSIRFKIIKKGFEENTVREMQKPIRFEINKKQFEELTKEFPVIKIIMILKLSKTKEIMIWKMQKNF